MIGLNYTIQNANGPLPLGTPVVVVMNGGNCNVLPDPVNAGRYSVQYPNPGSAMIAFFVPGCAPMIFNDTIPVSGGEAATNNPMVLLPL